MMPERCLEIAGLDLHYVVEQIQPSTDWPQLFVNASGVLIAALVAIWVAGAQHRRQVLQQTRQEVAAFLDAADKCVNHVHTRRLRESSAHEYEDWKAAQDRLTSKMYVVRLTAPHRIYVLASSVDHHVQTIIQSAESIIKLEISGEDDRKDYSEYLQNTLGDAQASYSMAVQELVNVSVNYRWWARTWARWKDRWSRARALRQMRKQGIEGCVDGPSVFDRSL